MMSNSMFDILMEIRKVDKQLSEQRLKVQQSEQELLNLEKDIMNVKELQMKALSILNDTERKSENTDSELNDIHETVKTLMGCLDEYFELSPENEPADITEDIDALKKRRDILKDRVLKDRAEREEIAMQVNEVDLQISIQKVKPAFNINIMRMLIYSFLHSPTLLHRRKMQLRY